MPRDQDLQWVEFTDFSPGIYSNNNLAGGVNITSTTPTYAQESGTFRCRSLPTGGLGPLPRRKESFALTTPPGDPDDPATDTWYVNGLGTWGQVFAATTAATDFDHRIEVHLLLSWNEGATSNWTHEAAWIREKIYDTTPSTETIYSDSVAAQTNPSTPQFAFFMKSRMLPSDPNSPGQPVMVCVWSAPERQVHISRAAPDPASPTTNSTIVVGTEASTLRRAVAHQGRIVFGKFIEYNRGANTRLSTDENFLWTETNDDALVSTTEAVFVPEIDSSITDMASMSANQLVVVKALGGGYVLSGDLSDVTVVRLPNLMSPDGSDTVQGVNTEKGWVYSAGDRGLYLWNGGDASTPLSPQLDGQVFTVDPGIDFGQDSHRGQCDRWMDLLLAPQLWVCDLEVGKQGAWWRLDDPDDYPTPVVYFSTSKYQSQAIGARATFTTAGTADEAEVFYLYQYDDLAYSWSWLSHPLWMTQARRLEIRAGDIAVQGYGTITVTVEDELGNTSVGTIDCAHDNIRNYRFDLGLNAQNMTVRIESEGHTDASPTAASTEAPLVHRLFLGQHVAQHLANVNN